MFADVESRMGNGRSWSHNGGCWSCRDVAGVTLVRHPSRFLRSRTGARGAPRAPGKAGSRSTVEAILQHHGQTSARLLGCLDI